MQIILASASKNRQAVLKSLSLPFKVIESNFNESHITETNHSKRTKLLAKEKALMVAKSHSGIIIAADTYTVINNLTMEKPRSKEEARKMLKFLSNKSGVSRTGFCYINTYTNFMFNKSIPTQISFRQLHSTEIEKYLNTYPYKNWAAAYALIDLYLLSLVKTIKGSLTGLTHGLPTEYLIPLLQKDNIQVSPYPTQF
jgi:septum formation protein